MNIDYGILDDMLTGRPVFVLEDYDALQLETMQRRNEHDILNSGCQSVSPTLAAVVQMGNQTRARRSASNARTGRHALEAIDEEMR